MRIPWRGRDDSREAQPQPVRLPQRWAIILGLAGAGTVALSVSANVGSGATAGLAIVGLLHAIMD
ncbi:hypothetical protein [Actinomadura sp. HBU206391]|uniref:hypothetical protein n=1 Tax=Actinomadura sp. HBU206391 TaxID=2731692 RepID=UPI00164F3D70|nr:hypothetical protein [Actinomadura sp. HBU206391]MBC6463454.1 hypothetical protein [Actinomadura sp. HBU206391]